MRRAISVAALIAVVIVAAASSASTASATILCTTSTNPCTGWLYGKGTALEAVATNAQLTTLDGEFKAVLSTFCDVTMTGKVTDAGTPLPVEFTGVAFSGCFGHCLTVEATDDPWQSKLKAAGDKSGNGSFTLAGGAEGPVIALDDCGKGKFRCRFIREASPVTWLFEGGKPAELRSSEEPFFLDEGGAAECGLFLALEVNAPLSKPAGPLYVM